MCNPTDRISTVRNSAAYVSADPRASGNKFIKMVAHELCLTIGNKGTTIVTSTAFTYSQAWLIEPVANRATDTYTVCNAETGAYMTAANTSTSSTPSL